MIEQVVNNAVVFVASFLGLGTIAFSAVLTHDRLYTKLLNDFGWSRYSLKARSSVWFFSLCCGFVVFQIVRGRLL